MRRNPRLDLGALVAGARFLGRLPSFLRNPLSPDEARAVLRQRFEQREATFLEVVGRAVYRHPGSPYGQLLRLAGCEEGDLRRLVTDDGVEGALAALFRRGVYLTVDEFKGRRPAIRGSTTVEVGPRSPSQPACGVPPSGSDGREPEFRHTSADGSGVCQRLCRRQPSRLRGSARPCLAQGHVGDARCGRAVPPPQADQLRQAAGPLVLTGRADGAGPGPGLSPQRARHALRQPRGGRAVATARARARG